MDDIRKRIDTTLADIRQEAEALRVRVHLAKLEANDEWQEIESKLAGVSAESAKDIGAAASLLGEELRKSFRKFVKHL